MIYSKNLFSLWYSARMGLMIIKIQTLHDTSVKPDVRLLLSNFLHTAFSMRIYAQSLLWTLPWPHTLNTRLTQSDSFRSWFSPSVHPVWLQFPAIAKEWLQLYPLSDLLPGLRSALRALFLQHFLQQHKTLLHFHRGILWADYNIKLCCLQIISALYPAFIYLLNKNNI